jgi:hypothetical protein
MNIHKNARLTPQGRLLLVRIDDSVSAHRTGTFTERAIYTTDADCLAP